jgi:hypothetical protein
MAEAESTNIENREIRRNHESNKINNLFLRRHFSSTLMKFIYIGDHPTNKTDIIEYIIFKKENLVFSIHKFFVGRGKRSYVEIISYNYETNDLSSHIYYASNSSGMLWRYCSTRTNGNLNKGHRYVTTTFINMDLQIFIFKSEKNFEVIDERGFKDCITVGDIMKDDYLKTRIGDDHNQSEPVPNISKNYIFVLLHNSFDSNFLSETKAVNSQLYQLRMSKNPLAQDLYKIIYDNILRHRTNGVELFTGKRIIFRGEQGTRTSFYRTWYISLCEFIFKHFTILPDTCKLVFPERDIEINSGAIKFKFKINIYQVDIRDDLGNVYTIYYIKFNNPNSSESEVTCNIINITKKRYNITKYGINDRYVEPGIFLYKLFDYLHQVGITLTVDDPIHEHYQYIGNIYHVEELCDLEPKP